MAPVLIVPGLNGSGEGHWQWWWLRDHPGARLVWQNDFANPDEREWMERLESAICANPGCIIVAHSLGSILTARLAKSRWAASVRGALLVAPADVERAGHLHRRTYEFGRVPTERLPFPSLAVLSHNDPYMPYSTARSVARAWGSDVFDLGDTGHVNIAAGYGRWPRSYDLAQRLIRRVAA